VAPEPLSNWRIAAIAAAQTFMRFKLPFSITRPDNTQVGDKSPEYAQMITTTIIVSGIVFGMLGFFASSLCRGVKRADENVKRT
jgi:hypothetical protein